ncbi:carbonic anhydrase [Lentinula aciculospora]|uniref:Carbonic anhydrase n=1 Tax=Lentinula aciculospora TaxID=153920 RepID=A0A9W9A5F6_9AGAR|nr:carbonic anhydrase [Lentinula aciculospora]
MSQDPIIAHMFEANKLWVDDLKGLQEKHSFCLPPPLPTPDQFPTGGQRPHTLWIGCGDSRVPETVVTGAVPGEIFVNRNVGNQVRFDDDSLMATLAFAVEELVVRPGDPDIIVCGHTECGAVSAGFRAFEEGRVDPGRTPVTIPTQRADSPLNRFLAPLTTSIGNLITKLGISSAPGREAIPALIQENVRAQVDNLCETEVIQNAWATRPPGQELYVHGWEYDIRSGLITSLVTRGPDSMATPYFKKVVS